MSEIEDLIRDLSLQPGDKVHLYDWGPITLTGLWVGFRNEDPPAELIIDFEPFDVCPGISGEHATEMDCIADQLLAELLGYA